MSYIGVIGGKSGDAITSELHKFGYKVALVCGKENEPGSDQADLVKVVDLREKDEVYAFFEKNSIKNVILATGHRYAIDLVEYLSKNEISINIDIDKVRVCKDKYETSKLLQDAGILVPKQKLINKKEFVSFNIKAILDIIGLPCVLKSIKDIKPPQLLFNIDDLHNEISTMLEFEESVFLEQYVVGSDCTVIMYNDGNYVESLGCIYYSKGKEDRLKGFEHSTSYALSKENEKAVMDCAERAILATGCLGVTRVDFIVQDGNKPYVLEINGVIESGLIGSTYCTRIKKQKINRAEKIVESALKHFGLECKKTHTVGCFGIIEQNDLCPHKKIIEINYDKIIKNTDNVPNGNMLPDLREEFEDYIINEKNLKYVPELEKILMHVINNNYDFLRNNLDGMKKDYIDSVIDYLNIGCI